MKDEEQKEEQVGAHPMLVSRRCWKITYEHEGNLWWVVHMDSCAGWRQGACSFLALADVVHPERAAHA